MKTKQIIATLVAAACVVIAISFIMVSLGASGEQVPPKGGPGQGAPVEKASSEGKASSAEMASSEEKAPSGEMASSVEKGAPDNAPSASIQNTEALAAVKERPSADLAQVGVYHVTTSQYQARVKGFGEVQPVDALTLTAQVSGQVESLAPRFKTGNVIAKGESLAYIDNTTYTQALTSAKATYEAAVVALEEERLQGEQAQDEWSRSGVEGEPASELVLRKPQLKAAQATVDDATQAVKMAQRDLAFTTITAPFDALVISREISPGSFIQAGESVASLYSAGQAEIAVALSPRQWQQLPIVSLKASQSSSLNWAVTLSDTTSDGNWQAVVSRVEFNEDEATRQRNAIVTVDMPLSQSKPLLFGSFVSAVIDGKMLNDVWKIPASAISQKNEVWYVKPNGNTLQKFTPTVLFQHDNFAFIEPLQDTQTAHIVARPLNSYLVNTAVAPVVEGTTGGADHE